MPRRALVLRVDLTVPELPTFRVMEAVSGAPDDGDADFVWQGCQVLSWISDCGEIASDLGFVSWALVVSNHRPPPCKGGALPLS